MTAPKKPRSFKVWVTHNTPEILAAYRGCWIGTRKKDMRDPAGFPGVRATLTLSPQSKRRKRKVQAGRATRANKGVT